MQKSLKLLVLCMMVFGATKSFGEAPAEGDVKQKVVVSTSEIEEIETGILYLLRCCPVHPVVQRPDLRLKVAVAIAKAAEKTNYHWSVLASMTYAESSFYSDAKGPIGEVGLMQLHTEKPWKHCRFKEQRELNRKSLEDQIICGAHWMRYGQDKVCNGTVRQGVSKFMTAGTCVPDPETSLDKKVNRRMRIMKVLKSEKVQEDFMETWEQNRERRAQYLAEKKARRQAKLQRKWNRRWKKRQQAKKRRQAELQAKWDAQYRKRASKAKQEKGIIFSMSRSETKSKPKG